MPTFPGANVGHAAGNGLAAVDLDIMDPELAGRPGRGWDRILDQTAIRVGRPPKWLALLSQPGHPEP